MNYTRTVAGRVTGSNGAIIAGTGFTVERTGVGAYTIRLQPRTGAILSATATAEASTYFVATVYSIGSEGTVSVGIYTTTTGTLADVNFDFTVTALERR